MTVFMYQIVQNFAVNAKTLIVQSLNSSECLAEIPDGAEEYNINLKLLKCKNIYIYILNGNYCLPHCYPTCEACSVCSEDEESQKCTSCNNSFYSEDDKYIQKIQHLFGKFVLIFQSQ